MTDASVERPAQSEPVPIGAWPLSTGMTGLTAYAPVATLLLLIGAVSIGNPHFLSLENIRNMFAQWAPAGIIAGGMTYVALAGGFDLSVASQYSFTAVVAAVVGQSFDPSIAFAATVVAATCFGTVNGFLVAVLRLNPYIATVGSGFMLNGLALLLTDNAAISVDNPQFSVLGNGRLLGMPYSGLLLIGVYVLLEFVLRRTAYGQSVYAVGGNYEASWLSGIRVRFITGSTYAVFSACCGLAGAITASQLQSAQANIDPGIIFDVLTIVVVGGTSLAGGSGAVWRTAIGLGIIATMSNGFVLLGVSPYYQDIIKGAIIVAALTMNMLRRA